MVPHHGRRSDRHRLPRCEYGGVQGEVQAICDRVGMQKDGVGGVVVERELCRLLGEDAKDV